MPLANSLDAPRLAALACRIDSSDPAALTNFAWLAARSGHHAAALRSARSAAALDGAPRAAWWALEQLAIGRTDDLALAPAGGLPVAGRSAETTSRLTAAIAAHQQAAHAVAEACYQAAIAEEETASSGWNGLAVLHEQRGEREAADEAWSNTVAHPTAATVHNRALSSLRRGDPLAGRELLADHWGLVIDSAPLLFLQGYLALISGDAETAIVGVRGAMELDPGLARIHFTLGLIQQEVGDPPAALASIRRALLMSPWYLPQVWLLSGVDGATTEIAAGEAELSVSTATESLLLSLGRSLLEAGHLGEALAVFDQALMRDTHHPVALFHRGVVLAKLRRYREALEDWESVGIADQTGDLAALSARHSVSARRLAELFSS